MYIFMDVWDMTSGAQAATHIHKPDVTMFRRLQDAANGLIRLVDIAPEEEGAMEFISELKDEVHISFAHTTADYDTAKTGYALGACHATHLYNAAIYTQRAWRNRSSKRQRTLYGRTDL